MKFKVGDKVNVRGVVTKVWEPGPFQYIVEVRVDSKYKGNCLVADSLGYYTIDGKYHVDDKNPCLFKLKPRKVVNRKKEKTL